VVNLVFGLFMAAFAIGARLRGEGVERLEVIGSAVSLLAVLALMLSPGAEE